MHTASCHCGKVQIEVLLPLATLAALKVRRLDGNDTWEFLD